MNFGLYVGGEHIHLKCLSC